MGQTLLLTMLFLPLAVGVLIFFLGSHNPKLVKKLALLATTATFVLAAIIALQYRPTGSPGREVSKPANRSSRGSSDVPPQSTVHRQPFLADV